MALSERSDVSGIRGELVQEGAEAVHARPAIQKVGIMTGGGDCPGLNAVIRAVVQTAAHRYGVEVVGILDGYLGLIEGRIKALSADWIYTILQLGGTILGSSNRDNPFKYEVREDGRVVYKDMSSKVLENIEKLGLDALIVIGGDGTLTLAERLYRMGVSLIGVPKTIDNDIRATDISFGFDSALRTATDAIDKIHTTAESHHRVMVVEVMGRNAGWIALQSGIAGGADIILIPEIPFYPYKVCEHIEHLKVSGKNSSVVVVAEGAHPVGKDVVVRKIVDDVMEPRRLGGVGNLVGDEIEERTGFETRVTILGHIQRGGSPTPFDRILATRFGCKAMELVAFGQFGRMVCLRTPHVDSVPLSEAVGTQRLVNPDGELVAMARAIGVSFGEL